MPHDLKERINKAIRLFADDHLFGSSVNLFKTLGYNTERTLKLNKDDYATLKKEFGISAESGFSEKNALVKEWKSINLLFQLTAEEMKQQAPLFQPTIERNEPASFLFFAIELEGKMYSRTQLSTIAREINKPFAMDVFVIFKYGEHLTLSLIERRPNKRIMEKDVLEKVTHIYNICIEKPHAAHVHILYTFSFEAIESESRKSRIHSFKELQAGWKKVASTQILNAQFYRDYQQLSKTLIRAIAPQQPNKMLAHQGVLNLLNRIMFIYFVQKKQWIMQDDNFIHHFWLSYLEEGMDGHDKFHELWLNTVFFSAFNGVAYKNPKGLKALPEPYKSAIVEFPYLNGGLFAENKDLDVFVLPDKYFHQIFKFFESYIFTIAEDTPYDVNLEINPELLGKMYEGMINATDLNDVDAEHGIVYTERPEINFMVRRGLVEVLDKKMEGEMSREFLYHFVFDTPEEKPACLKQITTQQFQNLRLAVTTLTACDPSCGSGSMLLGVIQVQMELLRSMDAFAGKTHTPKDDFVIKKQLISECIYGVDIKEWAVRIAELRLWLYMIAEAEFTQAELTKEPLLPNLDFKLRSGNSLLQTFGNLDFTLEELFKGRKKTTGAAKNLHNYIKKKKAFIQNQADSKTTYDHLKAEEKAVFLDLIQEMLIDTEKQLHNRKVSQGSMFGGAVQNSLFAEQTAQLLQQQEQLKAVRQFIHKEKRLPFSYDIDFMEVFVAKDEDKGFDLVIGNPPYVRQEEILPPEDAVYLEKLMKAENKMLKAKVNKEYKELLNNKVYKTYPFLNSSFKTIIDGKNKTIPVYGSKVPGRSDLYVYFQLLCPHYLNSKGTFCFIISNSWLDVDFGSYIQHFLLKHTQLHAVYDCNVRSFEAAVNTIIYLHSGITNLPKFSGGNKGYALAEPMDNTAKFIMNKVDYTAAAYSKLLIEQERVTTNQFSEYYRCIPQLQSILYQNGYAEEEKNYAGDKWGGKYLRAPEIYYNILEKGKRELVKLKCVSKIAFGIKTGANDFFYLDKKQIDDLEIEREFLVPIFKGPRECNTIQINPKLLSLFLFVCPKEKTELKGTNALKYIQWGEKSRIDNDGNEIGKFHERPSTRGRHNWFDVGIRKFSDGVFPCGIGDSFKFYRNKKVLIDKRLYEIYTDNENILASLNSSLTPLFLEVGSRTGLGDGLMDLTVYEAENTMIVDLRNHPKIDYLFNGRKVNDIFTELGFNKDQMFREQTPNPLPDRAALDKIVFDALGLNDEERNEVYWSVAELVQQRINKAASR